MTCPLIEIGLGIILIGVGIIIVATGLALWREL